MPISLASRGGELCELSSKSLRHPHPQSHHATAISVHHQYQNHRSSTSELVEGSDNRVEQPYMACSAFEERKLGHYGGAPKIMQGGWFEEFIHLGFEWVVFLSPTHCPYGANWGNCMVMKRKPDEVRCGHLARAQFKQVWDAQESRCYVGARYGNHITVSAHLDDMPAGEVRTDQAIELGEECIKWLLEEDGGNAGEGREAAEEVERVAAAAAQGKVASCRHVTLVGDLNAINPGTYDEGERVILDCHNRGVPCPTDAVEALNEALGALPLNTGQKFECRFNKCVTHAYSMRYTHYIDLLTDATDFDHQPLALYQLSARGQLAQFGP